MCSEVLVEKCRAELFRPWIHKFGHEVIVHSVRYASHSHCTCFSNQLLFDVFLMSYCSRFTPLPLLLGAVKFCDCSDRVVSKWFRNEIDGMCLWLFYVCCSGDVRVTLVLAESCDFDSKSEWCSLCRQPLVSGLYKMFTVCLRLCSKLFYFKVT